VADPALTIVRPDLEGIAEMSTFISSGVAAPATPGTTSQALSRSLDGNVRYIDRGVWKAGTWEGHAFGPGKVCIKMYEGHPTDGHYGHVKWTYQSSVHCRRRNVYIHTRIHGGCAVAWIWGTHRRGRWADRRPDCTRARHYVPRDE
jgi:hypothetical protein